MFKVITTSIREEHYDNTTPAEYAMSIYCNTMPGGNTMSSISAGALSANTMPKTSMVFLKRNPIESNIGNVKPKNPMEWSENGFFDAYGDLYLHGDLYADYDISTYGSFYGRGSLSSVNKITVDPKSNTFSGEIGDICLSPSYMYLCVETDTWVRWQIQRNW